MYKNDSNSVSPQARAQSLGDVGNSDFYQVTLENV